MPNEVFLGVLAWLQVCCTSKIITPEENASQFTWLFSLATLVPWYYLTDWSYNRHCYSFIISEKHNPHPYFSYVENTLDNQPINRRPLDFSSPSCDKSPSELNSLHKLFLSVLYVNSHVYPPHPPPPPPPFPPFILSQSVPTATTHCYAQFVPLSTNINCDSSLFENLSVSLLFSNLPPVIDSQISPM